MIAIGLILFTQNIYQNTLHRGSSVIQLGVLSIEEYNVFLNILDTYSLTATRRVNLNLNTIELHTNDPTLGNRIQLIEGSSPAYGEFISNINKDKPNQSGIFRNIIPRYDLVVYCLAAPQNLFVSSFYSINTTDLTILTHVLDYLYSEVFHVELFAILDNMGFSHLFFPFSLNQMIVSSTATFFLVLATILSLVQFSVSQLRSINIMLALGYSKTRTSITMVRKILSFKETVLPAIVIYIFFICYLILTTSYSYFYFELTLLFFAVYLALLILCMFMAFVILIIFVGIQNSDSTSVLKNKYYYFAIQTANFSIKTVFTVFFIVGVLITLSLLEEIILRRESLTNWNRTENLYRIQVFDVGQATLFEVEEFVTERIVYLYQHLKEHNKAFIMNSLNFENMELLGLYDFPMSGRVHGIQSHVIISPNYLNFNPIFDTEGNQVTDQLIHDDYVMNILVPFSFYYLKEELLFYYHKFFYFHKVEVENIYNIAFGRPMNTTPKTELTVNIIFVKDNQYYFTLNPIVRVSYGNRIFDTIAVVYTRNFHRSFLSSNATHSMFFYAGNFNPDDYISFALAYDASILTVTSSMDEQKNDILSDLRAYHTNSILLLILLLFSNVGISYNLFSNYYERNKVKLVLKSLWGYSTFEKHKKFLIALFLPLMVIVLITGIMYDIKALLVGAFLLAMDTIFILLKESLLQQKSFSMILKGNKQ